MRKATTKKDITVDPLERRNRGRSPRTWIQDTIEAISERNLVDNKDNKGNKYFG